MDSVNLRITSPRIKVPRYDLQPVAEAISASAKARILRGYNVLDQPSKPLTLAYARRKAMAGVSAIRNWAMSFTLMNSFGIQRSEDGAFTVGWPASQQDKVRWNEKQDHMAGMSPSDRAAGVDAARDEFKEYVGKIKGGTPE